MFPEIGRLNSVARLAKTSSEEYSALEVRIKKLAKSTNKNVRNVAAMVCAKEIKSTTAVIKDWALNQLKNCAHATEFDDDHTQGTETPQKKSNRLKHRFSTPPQQKTAAKALKEIARKEKLGVRVAAFFIAALLGSSIHVMRLFANNKKLTKLLGEKYDYNKGQTLSQ